MVTRSSSLHTNLNCRFLPISRACAGSRHFLSLLMNQLPYETHHLFCRATKTSVYIILLHANVFLVILADRLYLYK